MKAYQPQLKAHALHGFRIKTYKCRRNVYGPYKNIVDQIFTNKHFLLTGRRCRNALLTGLCDFGIHVAWWPRHSAVKHSIISWWPISKTLNQTNKAPSNDSTSQSWTKVNSSRKSHLCCVQKGEKSKVWKSMLAHSGLFSRPNIVTQRKAHWQLKVPANTLCLHYINRRSPNSTASSILK